jgi:hypothetical protein
MDQDPRIDQMLQITKDTNRMVHKMHRGILWGRFFTIAWWILVLAVSGYTYYVYAQPYVDKIESMYAQVSKTSAQAQSLQSEVSGFFGNLMARQNATTSTTTAH